MEARAEETFERWPSHLPWGGLRASIAALGAALGLVALSSLAVAAGIPDSPLWRIEWMGLAWVLLGLLLAYLFVPGFDLVPGRVVRRARGAPGSPRRVPTVALTFDDGPHPESTPALLAALEMADVKATFFLVGEQVRRHPELARRIAEAGHAIGNHTQRHRLLVFRTRAEVDEEIASCQLAIATAVGRLPSLFRPPHGFKPVGLAETLERNGLRMVSWQGTVRDTDAPGAQVIAERLLRAARKGRILLLHDHPNTRSQGAEAIPRVVDALRRRGFRFVTL